MTGFTNLFLISKSHRSHNGFPDPSSTNLILFFFGTLRKFILIVNFSNILLVILFYQFDSWFTFSSKLHFSNFNAVCLRMSKLIPDFFEMYPNELLPSE